MNTLQHFNQPRANTGHQPSHKLDNRTTSRRGKDVFLFLQNNLGAKVDNVAFHELVNPILWPTLATKLFWCIGGPPSN